MQSDRISTNQKEDTISLLDLISVIVKRKWFIFIVSFLAAGLIVLYSLYTLRAPAEARFNFLPNVYAPEVRVRLQENDSRGISSLLSNSDIGLLANIAGGVSAGPTNADLAQELLVGNTLLDMLAAEFNIEERFNLKENPRTQARQILRQAIETEYSPETGILSIKYESTDKIFATDILTSAIIQLEKRFKELTMQNVIEKKAFLEQQLLEYETDLKDAQQELIDFQREHGIINIELQAEYQLTALAALDAKIIQKESELKSLQSNRRPDDPEINRLKMELELYQETRELTSSGSKSAGNSIDIPMNQLPELSAIFLNLTRDLQYLQVIYTSLRSQYETVKIEEKDNSALFQLIEQAEVPEIKSGPSRGKICIITTVAAFFLAVFLSFVFEYFERVKQDPVESEKLKAIKGMLRLSRKK